MAGVAVILSASALSGCASIGGLRPARAALPPPHTETIYVASTRGDTSTSAAPLSFASYDISVPPGHRPGDEPRDAIDPANSFVEVGERRFASANAFARELADDARAAGNGSAEVVVFVHGFNTTFSESLARMAQLSNDFDLPAAPVLYAWPSDDRIGAYDADTERAIAARTGLRSLIGRLVASGTRRIVLVGYSMGAATVLHALGEMRAAGEARAFAGIDVVLLSPDLDIDEFRRLAGAIGKLPNQLVVFGSRDDLPLRMISALAHGGHPRLGALPDPELLADVSLTYVDVARVRQTGYGHIAVGDTPALIAAINAMRRPDLSGFATLRAAAIPGANTTRHGRMTYIMLPKMDR